MGSARVDWMHSTVWPLLAKPCLRPAGTTTSWPAVSVRPELSGPKSRRALPACDPGFGLLSPSYRLADAAPRLRSDVVGDAVHGAG